MEEGFKQPLPWWQNTKIVTIFAGLIAAAMPVTEFVGGYMHKSTELALNAQKQNHAMRIDYIDRAMSSGMTEADKEFIFGLFAEMDDQPALQRWAEKRHASLVKEIEMLQGVIKSSDTKKSEFETRLKKADEKAASLEREIAEADATPDSEKRSAQVAKLEERLFKERQAAEVAASKLANLKQQTNSLRVRVGEPNLSARSKTSTISELVDLFIGPERKFASKELVDLYIDQPHPVVDALIKGIRPPSGQLSYRVNLYIAYTLANIQGGWHGTAGQMKEIEKLKSTRNYDRDSTFKKRVDQALKNYAGTQNAG